MTSRKYWLQRYCGPPVSTARAAVRGWYMSAVPEMAPPPWAYKMAVLLPGEEPRLLGVCTYTCRSAARG